MLSFSIIIPVYKVEQYLAQCIESVLQQTYEHVEIILVDDGSPDSSPSICDRYAAEYKQIKVIHKPNGGLSDARNCGLAIASGDFVVFLDSDDYWCDQQALSSAAGMLENHPTTDIILFQRFHLIGERISEGVRYDAARISGHSKIDVLGYLVQNDQYDPSACMKFVRRSILAEHGIVFQKGLLSEDFDWTFHVFIHCREIHALSQPFYVYRWRADSISKTVSDKHLRDILGMIRDWYDKLPEMVHDSRERNMYIGVLGYMYGMLMSLVHASSTPQKRDELLEQMKPYRFLLDATPSKKIRKVKLLRSVMGFEGAIRILGLRNSFKMGWLTTWIKKMRQNN